MTITTRDVLPNDKIAPEALAQMQAFHRDFVDEVKAAVARDHIVVVGMAQNMVVKKAKRLLNDKKIAFTSIDHGSYLAGYRRRLAVKLWSGYSTFPMVFVDGTLIGGARELAKLLESGQLR